MNIKTIDKYLTEKEKHTEGKFNVFWKRNNEWSQLNVSSMTYDQADEMIRSVKKAGIKSVTDVSMYKVGDKPKK